MLGEDEPERVPGMVRDEFERMRMLGHGLGFVLDAVEAVESVLWLVSSEGALREEPVLVLEFRLVLALDSREPEERTVPTAAGSVSVTMAATMALKVEESDARSLVRSASSADMIQGQAGFIRRERRRREVEKRCSEGRRT